MKNRNHEVLIALQKVFRGARGNPSPEWTSDSRSPGPRSVFSRTTTVPFANQDDVIVQHGRADDQSPPRDGREYVLLRDWKPVRAYKRKDTAINQAKKLAAAAGSRVYFLDLPHRRLLIADYRD